MKAKSGPEMMERAIKENRQFVFIAEFDGNFLHVSGTATPDWLRKVLPALVDDLKERSDHEFSKQ